jgi:hypothetical protein
MVAVEEQLSHKPLLAIFCPIEPQLPMAFQGPLSWPIPPVGDDDLLRKCKKVPLT